MWGRSFQLGGLQLGSNFGLKPGWSSQSVPTLSGTAAAPSTVELYINDALRQTQQVGAGPFTIDNLQAPAGAAEARIVVRDILGRETVVVRPFFTSTQLLRDGCATTSARPAAITARPSPRAGCATAGIRGGRWNRPPRLRVSCARSAWA
jgi:outer membrane usher protein